MIQGSCTEESVQRVPILRWEKKDNEENEEKEIEEARAYSLT